APGEVDLLIPPAALAADGWFAPFIAGADARRVRLGVSRYRPGQPVFGEGAGAHISLSSDGTIPFAPRSAPFGELGEPVRRYELIRAGVATGLSLDLREAALAGATPNGGIRNLRLAPGKTSAAELATPAERPLLTVHELSWLDVDDQSGDLAAGISLATRHLPGAAPEPVAGGILLGNLFALWSRARLSAETSAASWYHGPSVRLPSVLVQ
ncbi:MAG TPA: metallopeptidase TldD-related protein, partial [Kofleriaceae bacterium]|nr:metallopeptidase TldD-related protein [Kofleriaceae bacterium]